MEYQKFPCGCSFPIREHPNGYKQPLVNFSINDIKDCPAVWDLFAKSLSLGVFQCDSQLGMRWSKELKPTCLEHLEAFVALLRPSCLNAYDENGVSITQHYCNRKNGKEPNVPEFPALAEILKSTYNLMLYQEDAMAIAHHICGFTLSETDSLIRKCVPGDTKFISKSRGWIEIDDLVKTGYKDDLFLTMDEYGNKYWKKIKDIWSVGKKTIKEIKSINGFTVETTKNHQVLTNNGWVANCKLDSNDYLIVPSSIEYDGKDEITSDLAFVIIGMIAEGYFVEEWTSHFTNFDEQMMEWWSDAFKKVFNCEPKIHDGKVARLTVAQKEYLNKWMRFGKSGVKIIPKVMMGMTKESTRKFLSFYLSCEGGCESHNYGVSSKSEELIKQIQLLLLRFGIIANKCKKLNPEYGWFHYLFISRREDQLKLLWELSDYWPKYKIDNLNEIIFGKAVGFYDSDLIPINYITQIKRQLVGIFNYDGGSVYKNKITRKKLLRLVKKMKNKKWKNFLNGKKRYEPIDFDVKSRKNIVSYDFTMEDEETPYIIANGIIIHNSLGKKDAKLLLSIEDKFIQGAKTVDKISVEDAKRIFDWLKAGARYSFNKCLHPKTNVQVLDGLTGKLKYRYISNVEVGDYVRIPNFNGIDIKYSKVLDVINQGKQFLYLCKFGEDWISCTLDHKFVTLGNVLKPLKDIIGKNEFVYNSNNQWVKCDRAIFDCHYLDTYDLEIEDENHVFYADDLAVSNSHASIYSLRAYREAYIKTHFPLNFYTSKLKSPRNSKTHEEINNLIYEAKLFNIEAKLPDLRDMRPEFYHDGEVIRPGLVDIKRFGSSNFNDLVQVIEKTGPAFWENFFEFCVHCSRYLTESVVKLLIGAGAVDFFDMTRSQMLEEYDLMGNLTKGEKTQLFRHYDAVKCGVPLAGAPQTPESFGDK